MDEVAITLPLSAVEALVRFRPATNNSEVVAAWELVKGEVIQVRRALRKGGPNGPADQDQA